MTTFRPICNTLLVLMPSLTCIAHIIALADLLISQADGISGPLIIRHLTLAPSHTLQDCCSHMFLMFRGLHVLKGLIWIICHRWPYHALLRHCSMRSPTSLLLYFPCRNSCRLVSFERFQRLTNLRWARNEILQG